MIIDSMWEYILHAGAWALAGFVLGVGLGNRVQNWRNKRGHEDQHELFNVAVGIVLVIMGVLMLAQNYRFQTGLEKERACLASHEKAQIARNLESSRAMSALLSTLQASQIALGSPSAAIAVDHYLDQATVIDRERTADTLNACHD